MRKKELKIQTIKTYDGIVIQDSIQSYKSKEAINKLQSLKDNRGQIQFDTMKEDGLEHLPHVSIMESVKPYVNGDIIAIISYTYKTPIIKPKMHPITIVMLLLTLWTILGIGFSYYMCSTAEQRLRASDNCKYYYENGVPSRIEADGITYWLEPDGSIAPIQETFVNPRHREMIAKGCTVVK